jgi:hypothetical protein
VWFAWGAENDEIQVPKKSAETGGHQFVGCFLLIAMKNEENFGYNEICWMFLGWL